MPLAFQSINRGEIAFEFFIGKGDIQDGKMVSDPSM